MHIKNLAPLAKVDEGKLCRILRALSARHCFQEGMSPQSVVTCNIRSSLAIMLQSTWIPLPTIGSRSLF